MQRGGSMLAFTGRTIPTGVRKYLHRRMRVQESSTGLALGKPRSLGQTKMA